MKTITEQIDKSSYSSLKITGDFSAELIRDWLSSCLDDLPKDSIDWFHYRNNFTQSGLQVNLADNSCLIMSNNVSSLSVIRDSILARSIQGNMQVRRNTESLDFGIQVFETLDFSKCDAAESPNAFKTNF